MSDPRKDKQLCAQARRVLSQYLSFESPDELLQSLFVEDVEPAPDATCLNVTLSVPNDMEVEKGDILERLHAAKQDMRGEIARTVTRRKAPDLNFLVVRQPSV